MIRNEIKTIVVNRFLAVLSFLFLSFFVFKNSYGQILCYEYGDSVFSISMDGVADTFFSVGYLDSLPNGKGDDVVMCTLITKGDVYFFRIRYHAISGRKIRVYFYKVKWFRRFKNKKYEFMFYDGYALTSGSVDGWVSVKGSAQ